ncbi:olfactory receptor 5AP2-like [Ambystoma mexicanum]|uniref:olfactory receptor 5AP2-like n=1 Tax=Ambystoma mexicanum TaxID=8296 RepID=UPI0037E76F01
MNGTFVTEFILTGLSDVPEVQHLLFLLFLVMYGITLVGNCGIVVIVWMSTCLHTPMYFFLANLSLVDICYSTTIIPQSLVHLLSERKTISFKGCATQLFSFAIFGTTECLLLAVMAFDRHTAICHPLHYMTIMNHRACIQLVAASFAGGLLTSAINVGCIFRLCFCGPNEIQHFFCDVLPLLRLSCTIIIFNKILLYTFSSLVTVSAVAVILASYVSILSTVLRIPSAIGRLRAFSTCASHFTCVLMFYGTIFFMYVGSVSSSSQDRDRVVSVFYTMVIPMLNPLVYSLRNRDVKEALKRITERRY